MSAILPWLSFTLRLAELAPGSSRGSFYELESCYQETYLSHTTVDELEAKCPYGAKSKATSQVPYTERKVESPRNACPHRRTQCGAYPKTGRMNE